MSDLKLSELTAEERAIVDRFSLEFSEAHQNETASTSYSAGWSMALQFILARRALFAPTKEECPNCGEMTSEPHLDRKSTFVGSYYSCKPAQPEPTPPSEMPGSIQPLLKLAKDRYNIMLCSGVSGLDTATAWRLAIEAAERFVNNTQQKADENTPPSEMPQGVKLPKVREALNP